MAYKYDYDPVPLPKRGYCCITKAGYVCWSPGGKYDAQLGYKVDHRVSIGKVMDGNRGMLYPNDRYFEIFEPEKGIRAESAGPKARSRINDAAAAFKGMSGKAAGNIPAGGESQPANPEADTNDAGADDTAMPAAATAGTLPPGTVCKEPSCGVWLLLWHIAQSCGLATTLKQHFRTYWDTMLALAAHAVDTPGEGLTGFASWSYFNCTGLRQPPESDEAELLLKRLGSTVTAEGLSSRWCAETGDHGVLALTIDTGQPPGDKPGTVFYADAVTGVPVWFDSFYGLMSDAAAMTELPGIGAPVIVLPHSTMVSDLRRCGNRDYIAFSEDSNELLLPLIEQYGERLRTESRLYMHKYRTAVLPVGRYAYGILKTNCVLCYSAAEAEAVRQAVYARVEWTERWVRHRRIVTPWLKTACAPYVTLTELKEKDARHYDYKTGVSQEAVQQRLHGAGFSAILSSRDVSAEDALRLKDLTLRIRLGAGAMYGYWAESLNSDDPHLRRGAQMMWLISLRLLQATVNTLGTVLRTPDVQGLKPALDLLRRIQCRQGADGFNVLAHALTEEQIRLLAAAGLTGVKIHRMVAKLPAADTGNGHRE